MFPGATNPGGEIISSALNSKSTSSGLSNLGGSQAGLPAGSYQIAGPAKTPPPIAYKKLNASQAKIFTFYTRMRNAERVLDQKKYSDALQNQTADILSGFGSLGRYFNSSDYKIAKNAADDWANAFLRNDSGAQISESEYARLVPIYIPQPNDGPKTVEMKKRARQAVMFSFRNTIPPAYRAISDRSFNQVPAQQQQQLPPVPAQQQQQQLPPVPSQQQQLPPVPAQQQQQLPPVPSAQTKKSGLSDTELLKSLGLK